MNVQEVMSTEVATVGRNDDLLMVEEIMASKQLRHVPVLENDELVGVVTQRDLFKARMSSTMGVGEKGQQALLHTVRVKEIMSHPIVTVTPETSVGEAANMMIQHGIGCLPVAAESKMTGIVTKTDLLRYLHEREPGQGT